MLTIHSILHQIFLRIGKGPEEFLDTGGMYNHFIETGQELIYHGFHVITVAMIR
jgi:hypothetical protein